MEINRDIIEALKECNIDIQAGQLVLLGIYYGLDVTKVCPEEVVRAIGSSKIVEKDYNTDTIKWNIPLFPGQQTQWGWVNKYNEMFAKINPSRKDNDIDVLKRMQTWFSKHPQYRKEDVKKATLEYMKTISDPQYLKSSAKFIFEGVGAMKKSMLLTWCEKVTSNNDSEQRGKIIK